MKKRTLLFVFTLLSTLTASAYDAEIDGIYYNLVTKVKQAEVTSGDSKYTGSVSVPDKVVYDGVTYNVTSIGKKAFYNSSELTSVIIPNSVTEIRDHAFEDCPKISSVTIPNSVTSIGEWAFSGCSGLTSITIPNSVTSIGGWAFANSKLKSVTIPNSMTTIENGVFCECYYLRSVTIPNSVISIGEKAFFKSGLTSLTIPNSVKTIKFSAFGFCSKLTSLTIGNSVTEIEAQAFSYCESLTSVNIPNSVTSIGDYAFSSCSGLTSVTIPNSVTSIGGSAFSGCSSLESVTIPNSVISIGRLAFGNCTALTSISIPSSVTTIDDFPFSNCTNLTSIIVESGNKKYDSRDNCNAIIETASNTLIEGCNNTTIPNSVKKIGDCAFQYCSGITSVIIPNSVESIGYQAFHFCRGLTEVTIPNSVTTIGSSAYQDCSSLTSVTIGSGVTSIEGGAFYYCSGLTDVYCLAGQVPNTGSNVFTYVPMSSVTLHVPYGSGDVYRATSPWNEFGTIVELEPVKPEGLDINETNFPDENFRNYLIGQSYGEDGVITDEEIAAITRIIVNNKNIKSLKGIEFFTALTSLNCYGNQLTSLDISKNTALTILYFYQNQIKGDDMDALVAGLPNLSYSGRMYAIYKENEGNIMSSAQVNAAKAKGWVPRYYDGSSWQEYNGYDSEEKKCATPTISFVNGKLEFSCETEGVEFVAKVTCPDTGEYEGSSIPLTSAYIVTVYAKKDGYENSDIATEQISLGGAAGVRGDVNYDNEIGMPDVMFIVNYILNGKFPDE